MPLPGLNSLTSLLQSQVDALTALPGVLSSLASSTASFAESVGRLPTLLEDGTALLARADRLMERLEGTLTKLEPGTDRLADAIDSGLLEKTTAILDGVDPAMLQRLPALLEQSSLLVGGVDVAMLKRMPALLDAAERGTLPGLSQMPEMSRDIRSMRELMGQLFALMEDVQTRFSGLPGAGLLKRRGEDKDDKPAEVKT
ncbi:MAG: hypothetical protein M3Z02_05075 [Actinomycetota bacterium]|nr:hypothetical protein [Actinomycetota bacterium]